MWADELYPHASPTPELYPSYPARYVAVWTLGFKQSSLRLAIQGSTDAALTDSASSAF